MGRVNLTYSDDHTYNHYMIQQTLPPYAITFRILIQRRRAHFQISLQN